MSIFEYLNYKAFLRDQIASLPKKGRGEVNRMAKHLGAHPTLVSQVLNGDRDFSAEQIHMLCGYLGLQPLESDYLILLLQHERAGTDEFKKYYKKKLDELKLASLNISKRLAEHRSLTDLDRSVFYSSWIYLAVWLFTSVEGGQSLESIAQRFEISRAQASDIISFLKSAHLCLEKDSKYQMQSQHIHLEFGSKFVSRHHTNWHLKALQRIEDLSPEEMMFTSPFSVSKKDFLKIREKIIEVIKSTSAIIKDSPSEDIACMNFDLFWIKK